MTDGRTRPKMTDRVVATMGALIRARITTGLVTVLPIMVTIWLIHLVYGVTRDASLWLVEGWLSSEWGAGLREAWHVQAEELAENGIAAYPRHIQWTISIVSVCLTLFLLYVIGLITANVVGRRALETGERVLDRVPLVKTVYRSCKQIIGSVGGDQQRGFQSVALIPFPNEKMCAVAFITSTFRDSQSGEELASVFMPSTPNPTTGFLEVMKRKDLIELDWTVEQAVTTIMSAGIIRPEYFSVDPAAAKPITAGAKVLPDLEHSEDANT